MPESTSQDPAATATLDAAPTDGEVGDGLGGDILDHLLKPDVQASLNELLENLPKLTEMVTLLTKVYDVGRTVATDGVLLGDLTGGLLEVVKPLQAKVKDIASAAIEAGDRAREDTSTIHVFGLLRMMKDPQVQKLLRFAQAFMMVLSEREKSGLI